MATPPLDKFVLSLGTLVPSLKSVALIVFEILAFNAEKYRGSRDFTPLFGKILGELCVRCVSVCLSVCLCVRSGWSMGVKC